MSSPSPVVRAARTSRWAAATVVLAALVAGCANNGLPESATAQGDEVTSLWGIFLWLAVAVAALIWLLTAYVVISSMRRRRRDGDDAVPRQKQYNTRLEVVYTAIPLVLVGVLFWMTTAVNAELDNVSDAPDLTVEVIGFQWQWQFRYPTQELVPDGPLVVSGSPSGPQGYPELVLPVGATVVLVLSTASSVVESSVTATVVSAASTSGGRTSAKSSIGRGSVRKPVNSSPSTRATRASAERMAPCSKTGSMSR